MCFLRIINKDFFYWTIVCDIDNLIDVFVDSYQQFTNMTKRIRKAIMEGDSSITRQGYCKPKFDKLNEKLVNLNSMLQKGKITGDSYTKFSTWLDWWTNSSAYNYYQQESRNSE